MDFAVGNPEGNRRSNIHLLASGRYAINLSLVCATPLIASSHFVPLSELECSLELDIGKCVLEAVDACFYPL